MAYKIARTLTRILALTLLCQTLVYAEDQPMPAQTVELDPLHKSDNAAMVSPIGKAVSVITVARPTHRTACRVQSFTSDQLTCKGHLGRTRIYKTKELAALILPGDDALRVRILLGLNAALGSAIWATVVLAPTCAPCAAATAFAAFCFFAAAGAISYGDGQPDRLYYLAPGQQLHDAKGRPIHIEPLYLSRRSSAQGQCSQSDQFHPLAKLRKIIGLRSFCSESKPKSRLSSPKTPHVAENKTKSRGHFSFLQPDILNLRIEKRILSPAS